MKAVTTEAARLSTIMWQMAVELSRTHCHQVRPATRAEVSSDPTTELWRTTLAMAAAAVASGVSARPRMLAMAPWLMKGSLHDLFETAR